MYDWEVRVVAGTILKTQLLHLGIGDVTFPYNVRKNKKKRKGIFSIHSFELSTYIIGLINTPEPQPLLIFCKSDVAAGFISNIDLILLIETSCHFSFTIHYVNILKIKFLCPVTFRCIKLLASLEPQYKGLTQFILLTWAILNRNYFLSTLETAFDFSF